MELATHDGDDRVRKVELIISGLLRSGVITSIVLVVIGMVVLFSTHPELLTSSEQLHVITQPGADFPHTLYDVFNGLRELNGEAIIAIGLFVLIATPVMRVAVSIFAFIYQRDRVFTAITSVVLLFLLLSFFLGGVE